MSAVTNQEAELDRNLKALTRLKHAKKAAKDLITFCQFTSPDPNDPDDSEKSLYEVKRHHRALAAALEEVAAGRIKRLIVTVPPRHGKTEIIARKFIPQYLGRNPGKHVIYATFNELLAKDIGLEVKETLTSSAMRQVFPNFELAKGGKASGRIRAKNKSMAYFVGRGGTITGRGGHLIVVDDLFKNDQEADSPKMRDTVWKWFIGTVMNRFMTDEGCLIIVMTRWHEDDVIGRLTDKENPNYNEEIAQGFSVVNLPAVAEENDLLGRPVGEPLWPERFGVKYLSDQKALSSRRFFCLYQGNPAPEEGTFFLRKWARFYQSHKVSRTHWRFYGASDLAVGTKDQQKQGRQSDRSALIMFALDNMDDIHIIDAIMTRERSDRYIEFMIDLMKAHRPLTWFGYQDQITGSIGPFLFKRMKERKVYCHVKEMPSTGSKEQKAQPFRARMAMGKVYFPQGKSWASDILDELIRFPGGKHDDCVDACALFGQGMDFQVNGSDESKPEDPTPLVGTMAWLKYSSEMEKRDKALRDTGGF